MQRLMEKKYILGSLFFNIITMFVFFGGLIRKSFNADTITYMVYTYDDIWVQVGDGRYLVALYDFILYKLMVRATDFIPLCIAVSIILFAATSTIIQLLFREFLKSENIIVTVGYYCALGMAFTNVLFIEYLMFPEVVLPYSVGYLAAAIGVYCFAKDRKIVSFLLFLLGACAYQITVVYSAIVLAFYYMLLNRFHWSKKAFVEEVLAFALPLCAGVINMKFIKLLGLIIPQFAFRKRASTKSLLGKIPEVMESLFSFLKDSFTLLPSIYLPALFTLIFLICAIVVIVKSKSGFGLLYYIIILLGALITLFVIPVLGKKYNFPPRMSYGLYLIQGMLAVTLMATMSADGISLPILGAEKEACLKVASIVVFGYVWVQLLFCSFIISGRLISNTLDRTYAKMIVNEIEKYEEETGKAVLYFAAQNDTYAPAYYDESRLHYGQINERALGQTTRTLLEAVEGRHFEAPEEDTSAVFDKYFGDRNWDSFDLEEQLVIIDDTAYLCVY